MTNKEFLNSATKTLRKAGIESARLDVLVLLEDALATDRALILAHPDAEIPHETEVELNTKIIHRAGHTPLAYLRGHAEFYGRIFTVHPGVLVPRPETEAMIELMHTLSFEHPPHVADIGTGTGCLGITAALETPTGLVDLYDIDPTVLDLAGQNAKKYNVKVQLYHENLLQQAASRHYDVVLANLPYVPQKHPLNQAAQHEPKLAIISGEDGLEAYRELWDGATALRHRPRYLLTEALLSQHAALAELAHTAGYVLKETRGLVQLFETANWPALRRV